MTDRKMRSVKLTAIATALVIAAVIGINFFIHANDPIRGDEAAWVFSGVYFDHFLKFDRTNSDWMDDAAIDHPPFAKYYFGAAARLAGSSWTNLDDVKWWLGASSDFYNEESFRTEITRRVPARVVVAVRIATALAAFASCMALFALGALLSGPLAGAAAALAFVSMRMVLYFAAIAEADFVLIAIVLWQLFFLLKWVRASDNRRSRASWLWAIASGVFLGVAFVTKLNGLIAVPVSAFAACCVFLKLRGVTGGRACALLQTFVMFASAAGAAWFLNPVLAHPFSALALMLDYRAFQTGMASLHAGMGEVPAIAGMILGWQQLMRDMGLVTDSIYFPLGLALLTAGSVGILVHMFRCERPRRIEYFIVALAAVLWIGTSLWAFSKIFRFRYLITAAPFVALAVAAGVVTLKRAWANRGAMQTSGRRIVLLSILLFVLLWTGPTAADLDGKVSLIMKSDRAKVSRLEYIAKMHPEAAAVRIDLGETYVRLGHYDKAARELDAAAAQKPENKMLGALSKTVSQIAAANGR